MYPGSFVLQRVCLYGSGCVKTLSFNEPCSLAQTVTQLEDIKRQKVKLESLKREAEGEKQRAREAARERVLQEFEKGQLGLSAATSVATTSGAESKERQYAPSLLAAPIECISLVSQGHEAEICIRRQYRGRPRQGGRGQSVEGNRTRAGSIA